MNHLRGKISGTFNNVKEELSKKKENFQTEAEQRAEKLKGDVKDLLNSSHKGIVDMVDSVSFHKTEEDGETSVHHLETSIPVMDEAVKQELETVDVVAAGGVVTPPPSVPYGDNSVELDTSIPAVYEDVKAEIATVDVRAAGGIVGAVASQHSVHSDDFSGFFASIFEKCCAPFNKKND